MTINAPTSVFPPCNMDRITSRNLLEKNRRVTRSQVKNIKNIFPFLHLSAELRNLVYTFSSNVSTLEHFFDKAYKELVKDPDDKPRRLQPAPRMTTPHVYLINKQIFREASYLLQKQGVGFHHGLLKHDLCQIISGNILRQVATLEITDAGHPMLKGGILPMSWSGYMNLMKQLGELLSNGEHKLKKLTIDFKDPRLVEHMTRCHVSSHNCGFRDQMSNALAALGTARGIGQVTLRGLNVDEAAKLKKLMEKPAISLLNLPREIRDTVYENSLDWSDTSIMLDRALANWSNKAEKFPFPARTTPSVLLLNKKISSEALEVLHKKSLHIVLPCDDSFKEHTKIPSILAFITRNTLKHVTTIRIDIQSWAWIFNLNENFTSILAASANLKHFHLNLRDGMKPIFQLDTTTIYPDNVLASRLKLLTTIRGLESVHFAGDLPLPYTLPLTQIMTSPSGTDLKDLPVLKGVLPDGEVVDVDDRDLPPSEERQWA